MAQQAWEGASRGDGESNGRGWHAAGAGLGRRIDGNTPRGIHRHLLKGRK